ARPPSTRRRRPAGSTADPDRLSGYSAVSARESRRAESRRPQRPVFLARLRAANTRPCTDPAALRLRAAEGFSRILLLPPREAQCFQVFGKKYQVDLDLVRDRELRARF